ncbi:MAG TPA: hypothetical protein VGH24_06275 [Solirubrobacteraceae bacterium]|jgi:hypothetical protein
MAVADPVAYETRVRPRYAVIAAFAGVLLFAGAAVQAAGAQAKVSELTVQLLVTDKRGGLEIVGTIVNGLGVLGLAVTLTFLFNAARARKPGMNQAIWYAAIAGAVLAAVGGIAYGAVITAKAHDFATHGAQTYPQANQLLSGAALAALQYAGLIGSLLLAVSFVLVSLNAMRVGLLTKFMGYIGIIAAGASLLLIGSAPALLIEVFWLLAVGYLLIGRWPKGDPPAWHTGKAEPWPTAAEVREQRQDLAAKRRNGRGGGRVPEPEPAPVPSAPQSTRASTPKRKRKRRK